MEEAAAPWCPLVWRLCDLAAGAHTDARTDGQRAPDVIIFRLGRLWSRTARRCVGAGTTDPWVSLLGRWRRFGCCWARPPREERRPDHLCCDLAERGAPTEVRRGDG